MRLIPVVLWEALIVACNHEPVPRLPDPNYQYSGGSVTGNALELDVAENNIGKVPVFWHLPDDVRSSVKVGYWIIEPAKDSSAVSKSDSLLYTNAREDCKSESDQEICRHKK